MSKGPGSFVLSTSYRLALSVAMSVFFAGFLIFFLPFGVSNYDPDHEYTAEFLLFMAGIGGLVGAMSLLNEFALRPRLPNTTSGPGMLAWSAWVMVSTSLVIFLGYNYAGDWHDFRLLSALAFIVQCSAVLIFPLLGTYFFFRYRELRTQFESVLQERDTDADPSRMVYFAGSAAGDRIGLRLADFRYGRAQDNYVELHYLDDGQLRSHLLRATVTGLAEAHRDDGIVRCHRSYLVNLHQVLAVRGGRSGLALTLDGVENPIPVSRSFRDDIIAGLRTHRGLEGEIPG